MAMVEILTVCTGNICRSALSDVLLRSRLAGIATVSSAGAQAMVGDPLTPQTADLAMLHGASADDVAAHRARHLTEQIAQQPDLALAMTRAHRARIVDLAPGMLKRAFTAREFLRLSSGMTDAEIAASAATAGGDDPKKRLRAALRALGNRRGVVGPPEHPEDDDVIDPYLQSQDVYDAQAAQLVPAVDEVARFVRASVTFTA